MARLVTLNRLDCDSLSIADLKKLEGTNAAAAAETAKTLLKLDQELSQDPAFAKETAAKVLSVPFLVAGSLRRL